QALLPAIDTILTYTIEACRRVDAYPLRERFQDLHYEGNGRFQLGNGGMACFGKRPCTGGTMVQSPGFATLYGVGALGLDVFPMTVGTSHLGQCQQHLRPTTRLLLCGGAGLYTTATSN